jgi:hypothetical protein
MTAAAPPARRVLLRVRVAVSGAVAAVLGLLPHLLHHVGPLAGAGLFAGIGGSLLFGLIGLIAAVPFLLRVRRRRRTWRVPALLFVAFGTVFSISTFVVGPAITGGADDAPATTAPGQPPGHEAHH